MLSPASKTRSARRSVALSWSAALLVLAALSLASLAVGVSDVSWNTLWSDSEDDMVAQVLMYSRVPRTLALLLAGSSMAVAGLLMQMLARNHFVEPSTVGTAESATFGMMVTMLFAPQWPVLAKMGMAALFALGGSSSTNSSTSRFDAFMIFLIAASA